MKKNIIADARKKLGLTMPEMAAVLDVDRTTILRWERGDVPVSRVVEMAVQMMLLKQHRAVNR